MTLRVEVAGKSDVGCVRTNNEDNFGFDTRCGIFVVCDGMGGMAAGEVASKMGVDVVLNYFREGFEKGQFAPFGIQEEGISARANALGSAIQMANSVIFEAASKHAAHSGMGSTIVAVHVESEAYSIGHVGDSRIYLVRGETIRQLTDDHSLVMEQVRRGLITLEEAKTSEVANIIIRALGTEDKVRVDLADLTAEEGDILVLCSDGLTRHLEDTDILASVAAPSDLEDACAALVGKAKERGAEDNVTVVLVRFATPSLLGKILGAGGAKWQDSM